MKKNELERKEKKKITKTKTPLLVNGVRQRTKEKTAKMGKITGRPKPKNPPGVVAAVLCYE